MSKTLLTESQIEEIIFLETLSALRDAGQLPKHSPEIQEKVDLLKEGGNLDEVLGTVAKGLGSAVSGGASILRKGGSALAGATNLFTAPLAAGLGVGALGALSGTDDEEDEEEEEEIPEEEKTWLQVNKDRAKQAIDNLTAKGPGGKDRERHMRPLAPETASDELKATVKHAEKVFDIIGPAIGMFFPVYGDFIDLMVAAKNFYKRDYINGLLMTLAAVPLFGVGFNALYIAIKTGNKVQMRTAARALVETGLVGKGKGAEKLAVSGANYVSSIRNQLTDRDMLKRIFDAVPAKKVVKRLYGIPVGSFDEFVRFMVTITDWPFAQASFMKQMVFPLNNLIQAMAESEVTTDAEGNTTVEYDFNEGLDFANEQIHKFVTTGIPIIAGVAASGAKKAATIIMPSKVVVNPRGGDKSPEQQPRSGEDTPPTTPRRRKRF